MLSSSQLQCFGPFFTAIFNSLHPQDQRSWGGLAFRVMLIGTYKVNMQLRHRRRITESSVKSSLALVACRSEFVTANASGRIRVLPLDRFGIGGVGLDVAADLSGQVVD